MKDLSLGEKIRNFRKRAGKSQFELETAIGAANGTVSRIESDQVNPTKETLFKIAEALTLTGLETAELFGIESVKLETSNSSLQRAGTNGFDISDLLDLTTGQWVKLLGVDYAVIWIWDEDEQKITVKSMFVPPKARTLVEKAVGKIAESIELHMTDPVEKNNHYLVALETERILATRDITDISNTVIDEKLAQIIQGILGMKMAVTIPLIMNKKKLGVLGLIWKHDVFTKQDHIMMETFANQISITIYNTLLLEETQAHST